MSGISQCSISITENKHIALVYIKYTSAAALKGRGSELSYCYRQSFSVQMEGSLILNL